MGSSSQTFGVESQRVAGHLREAEQALTMQAEVLLLLTRADAFDGEHLLGEVRQRLLQAALELRTVAYVQLRRAGDEDADDIPF